MFMHIVLQLSGRVTALFTQALAWLKALLLNSANKLRVLITRVYQNVINRRLLVALTESNISLWRVNLITAVQLIKAGLTTVQVKAFQIGLRLLTTAHQISQRVLTVLLLSKDKLVELIKSVQLRLNESKIALTYMVAPSTQDGLKSQDRAKQRQQPANKASKKGK